MRAFIPVVGAIALLSIPAAGHASGLSAAADFNVLTFGDFTSSSDVEGKLAVGGDAHLSNFSVGSRLDATANGSDTLVVGGALTYSGGSVLYGNAAYGTTYTGPGYNVANNGTVRHDPNAFNFGQAQADLTTLSASLAGQAANGATDLNPFGQVTLTGTDSALNVFSLTTAQLATVNGFQIDVPTGSTTLINVTGANAVINGFGYWGTGVDRYNTLFNFVDATALFAQNNGIEGSVLAPLADATLSGGSVNGQFIARSANMLNGAEGHHYTFTGSLPPGGGGTGSPVPEPGSMALLAMGVLPALPLLRRRRIGA